MHICSALVAIKFKQIKFKYLHQAVISPRVATLVKNQNGKNCSHSRDGTRQSGIRGSIETQLRTPEAHNHPAACSHACVAHATPTHLHIHARTSLYARLPVRQMNGARHTRMHSKLQSPGRQDEVPVRQISSVARRLEQPTSRKDQKLPGKDRIGSGDGSVTLARQVHEDPTEVCLHAHAYCPPARTCTNA